MNREDIIRMAREAGCEYENEWGNYEFCIEDLERFAQLVAAAEREACAKIVESNADACRSDGVAQIYLYSNAAAIRARGNT